jgi:hypothetical protein
VGKGKRKESKLKAMGGRLDEAIRREKEKEKENHALGAVNQRR